MNWTALIPLKAPAARKSRLAEELDLPARAKLTEAMFDRVAAALRATPRIDSILLLAANAPEGWHERSVIDQGRGLNVELAAARAALGSPPLIVIHADLPFVSADDITALLDAAGAGGCAIAPDRHGTGTNAVAIAGDRAFRYHFGADSLRAHVAEAGRAGVVVEREGLGFDCDTPADLALAAKRGFGAPWP